MPSKHGMVVRLHPGLLDLLSYGVMVTTCGFGPQVLGSSPGKTTVLWYNGLLRMVLIHKILVRFKVG